MTAFVGKTAIDFSATVVMPNNQINENFNLKSYIGNKKAVLFFYPLDFTFVCPSELIALHSRIGAFAERGTIPIAVSIDSHFCHLAWKNTTPDNGGIGQVLFPMVADINKDIARSYNVLTDEGVALRGTFIIDEDFVIRHATINDLPLGRNIDETLRMVDALSHFQNHGEVCPAGWRSGKTAMTPTTQGVQDYLSSNSEDL